MHNGASRLSKRVTDATIFSSAVAPSPDRAQLDQLSHYYRRCPPRTPDYEAP